MCRFALSWTPTVLGLLVAGAAACGPPADCTSFDYGRLTGVAPTDDGVLSSDDPALEACERYVGSLEVTSVSDTTSLSIPALAEVTGSLNIDEPFGVGSGTITFDALARIGDDLVVQALSGGVTVEAPSLVALNSNGGFEGGRLAVIAYRQPVRVLLPALAELDSLELTGDAQFNGETDTLRLSGVALIRGQSDDRTGLILSDMPHRAVDLTGVQLGSGEDSATVYLAGLPALERVDLALAAGSRVKRLVLAELPELRSAKLQGVDRIGSLSISGCRNLDPCDVTALMAIADQVEGGSQVVCEE